jgi:hypothetical protein
MAEMPSIAPTSAIAPSYEPPRIEQLLTPEDLEREAMFAQNPSLPPI